MLQRNEILIRQELAKDFPKISALVKKAFSLAEHSDGDEHNLICRIRDSEEYIPELSLVACLSSEIVGCVMFSTIAIGGKTAVALAPIAVSPRFQKRGIGSLLIEEGHKKAKELGFSCSVVLCEPKFYSKFGYTTVSNSKVYPPFSVPEQFYMLCCLNDSVEVPQGVVKYSKAFGL